MKQAIIALFVILFATSSFAQDRKADSVCSLIIRYFNARQSDSIYMLTGENFRTHVSKEALNDAFTKTLFPIGAIQASEYMFTSSGVLSYKLTVPSAFLQLKIRLDSNDKLSTFAFKPYKEPQRMKTGRVATSNPLSIPFDKLIDTIVRPYISAEANAGVAIGILRNHTIHTYGYGETTKGTGNIPDLNTIFEIGSVSKTFTATLLAYFVNEGKVKLSDPVTKYLPDSVAGNKALQGITLLMLSNHTSGLPRLPDNIDLVADSSDPYAHYDTQKLYSYLKNCTLLSIPGKTYTYSNLAAGLLGTILEHVSGKTYEQLVASTICKPLHMNNTTQHLSNDQQKHFTTVYDEKGGSVPAWSFMSLAAAGAIRSTINDLLLYAQANMDGGSSDIAKAIKTTHTITYDSIPDTHGKIGMGWHINTLDSENLYWHNGGTYGSSSYIGFIPSKNIAVVVLSNSGNSVDEVAANILSALLKP